MDTTIYAPKNEKDQIKIRRCCDTLAISGGMVIALSVWDIIKLIIGLFLGEEATIQKVRTAVTEASNEVIGTGYEKMIGVVIWIMFWLVILAVSAVILIYHLYIGLNAMKEGHRTETKRKRLYLVLSFISAVLNGGLIILGIFGFFSTKSANGSIGLAAALIELTTFLNYVFILYTALTIRKLESCAKKSRKDKKDDDLAET